MNEPKRPEKFIIVRTSSSAFDDPNEIRLDEILKMIPPDADPKKVIISQNWDYDSSYLEVSWGEKKYLSEKEYETAVKKYEKQSIKYWKVK